MLQVKNVDFSYGNYKVLKNINLELKQGETVGLLGPSGVGKSTLFQLITGLIEAESGQVLIDESPDIKGKISYMLQKDMLYEHYTVLENIMLPRLIAKDSKEKAREMGLDLLAEFNLSEWANHFPHALSGGMRQRIAFLRTAAFQREWLLLDESFSALDAFTRRTLHQWFIETRDKLNWSTLLITHDVDEALILCDRIYVLTGQPGSISHELIVDLETSDSRKRIFEPAFLAAKKELLAALENQKQ